MTEHDAEELLQRKDDDVRIFPPHFFAEVKRDKGIASRAAWGSYRHVVSTMGSAGGGGGFDRGCIGVSTTNPSDE
jgi:hypothetical protein